jgi:hypothetical protein
LKKEHNDHQRQAFGCLDLRVVAMLAEIFMVRLEAAARLMEETIPSRASRFTPFIVGARFTAQAQQPPKPIAPLPNLNTTYESENVVMP